VKGLQYLATTGSLQLTGAPVTQQDMGVQRVGDVNNDNLVDIVDFTLLRASFGLVCGDRGYDGRAEFTGDCLVDIVDFTLLRSNFGEAGSPPPAGCGVFADVGVTHPLYEPITHLAAMGVVAGYPDGTFRPDTMLTRGQLAKMVVLALTLPVEPGPAPPFADVPADSPVAAFVATLHRHGLISGYTDGTFRPEYPVTRGQLAKILVPLAGWEISTPRHATFADVGVESAFYPYIETAQAHHLFSGYADGIFRPNAPATRGQACQIIASVIDHKAETFNQP
jgi:hypothetical protein